MEAGSNKTQIEEENVEKIANTREVSSSGSQPGSQEILSSPATSEEKERRQKMKRAPSSSSSSSQSSADLDLSKRKPLETSVQTEDKRGEEPPAKKSRN